MNLGSLFGGGGLPGLPSLPGLPGLPGMGGGQQQGGGMQQGGMMQPIQPGQSEEMYPQNLAGLYQMLGGQQQPQNMNLISGGGLI